MSKTRTCIACQNSYQYCPHCGDYARYPKWMNEFDTEACKELFNVISGYNMGIFEKNDVKKVVDKYEIKDFSVYKESIANKLNELFSEPVVEVANEISEEKTVVEETVPSFNRRKSNKKKNRNVDIDLTDNDKAISE